MPKTKGEEGKTYQYKPPKLEGGKVSRMVLNPRLNPYPYARTLWVTEEARNYWKPKIDAASAAFHKLETLTVFHGVRRVFTTHFSPENLVDGMKELAKKGLVFLPLHRVGTYTGFAHYHPPVEPGKPWTYYGVVGKLSDALEFAVATEVGDHKAMGELLGYPGCCTEAFNTVWRAGYIDPIWQAGEASYEEAPERFEVFEPENRFMRLKPVPESLPVLRYIGIRLVSHIPHSLTCEASIKVAEGIREVAKEEGLYYGALEYADEIFRLEHRVVRPSRHCRGQDARIQGKHQLRSHLPEVRGATGRGDTLGRGKVRDDRALLPLHPLQG